MFVNFLKRIRRPSWALLLIVVLPTALATIYYGFIASDVYTSESRFIVRSPQRQQQSLLGSIFSGTGFTRSQDDAFTVHDFVLSRDALKEIDETLQYQKSVSNSTTDFLSRFAGVGSDTSFEALYKFYGGHVSLDHDSASSISVLRVRGFSADDVFKVNSKLLNMGELLVNQINDRGRTDLVKYAQAEVDEAEKKSKDSALALASYRNQRTVFDPDRQSALQLQQTTKLQEELIASKMQLVQVRTLSPENPQIPVLQKRVEALQRELDSEMGKVIGGGANSLTNKAADFERLSLERAFADRQLASAMSSLEAARNEARRKSLYLERIVQPNKPDTALEPRRIRAVAVVLIFGLIAWGIFSLLLGSIKEHKD